MAEEFLREFKEALKNGGHHTFHALHFLVANISQLMETEGKVEAYRKRSDPFSHSHKRVQMGIREFKILVDLGFTEGAGKDDGNVIKGKISKELIAAIYSHYTVFNEAVQKASSTAHKQTRFEADIEAMIDSDKLPNLKAARFLLENIENIASGNFSSFTVHRGKKTNADSEVLIEEDVFDALCNYNIAHNTTTKENGINFQASFDSKQVRQMWHESHHHQSEIAEWQEQVIERISQLETTSKKK